MSKTTACWCVAAFAATVICGTSILERPDGITMSDEGGDVRQSAFQMIDERLVRDSMPSGSEILFDVPKTRGWRQTWRMAIDIESAKENVESLFAKCGYSQDRTVGDAVQGRFLSEWKNRDGHRVMWTIWAEGQRRTGFSWGEVK